MAGQPLPTSAGRRIWVDIDSTQDILVTGLRTILETALGASVFTTVGPVDGEPDVVLFDVTALQSGVESELDRLVSDTGSVVIAVTLDQLRPDLEALALNRGAAAAIPLGISAEDLVGVIRAAIAGNLAEYPGVHIRHDTAFVGKDVGLSPRESQIIALIVLGKTNQEIADEFYLSINSVKTYIRSAYRKLDVSSRTQAVAWGIAQGFPVASTSASPAHAVRRLG
jgi:NarL family two-component system response regulator LiaR